MKQSWLRPLSMALFLLLPSMYAVSVYAAATLTVSPMSLDFGYQLTGTTSATKPVTLKNTGPDKAIGILIVKTGDYIVVSDTCPADDTLAVAATCIINVAFKPAELGPRAGALNITSTNAAAVKVGLTGIGPIAAGAWNAGAAINAKRIYHTATKLADGTILIVGGYNENGSVNKTVERLNLYTGLTSVGSLAMARGYHTATICDGMVLVVGGVDSNNAVIGTAELYSISSMTSSGAGTMSKARHSHTATLLPGAGCNVLITGGIDAVGNYISTSEIYSMTSGTWSNTGSLNNGRSFHTATLLANGKVLVTGGSGNDDVDFLRSSELYNPIAGTWTLTGNLVTGRNSHTATLLANNKVLVVGGYNDSKGGSLNDAETYNPATGLWTPAANLSVKRNQHTETLLHNGEVLITGGVNETGAAGANKALNSAEVYNPSTDAWRMVTPVDMGVARFGHTATLLDIIEVAADVKKVSGKVYVVGGSDDTSGALDSSELYSPVAVTLKATEIKFNGNAAGTPPTTGITAKLNGRVTTWNANGPTTVSFDFGRTTSYGASIAVVTIPVSKIDQDVSVTAGVLPCGEFEYHYRIRTITAKGTAIYGSDQTFKTLPCKITNLKVLLTDNKTNVNAGYENPPAATPGTADYGYVATITNLGPAFDVVAGAIFKAPIVGNLTTTSVTCTEAGGAKCPKPADTNVGLLQGTGIIIPQLPKGIAAKLTFNIKSKVAINAPNGSVITYGTSITAPKNSFIDKDLSNNTARDGNRVTNPYNFPDLLITGITVTPASPKINTVFSAVVTVKNVGSAPIVKADGVFLDVWVNRAASATCDLQGDAFAPLETLAVGESKPLTVSMTASPIAGAKVVRAYIDSTCNVKEFDDANNQAVKNYNVIP